MSWSGRSVLVTGAGGFIGSHLAERLVREGAKVRALVHYNGRSDWGHVDRMDRSVVDKLEIVPGDVTDPFAMDRLVDGCDVVFHLAALIGIPYSYVAPSAYVDVNVRGSVNLLEAARRHGVARFIQTSTSEVYGTAQRVPIDEDHPLQGQSPYSASKIAADKMAESYHLAFGVPVTTVRPFNTYGPRQSARAVIPTIITQALQGGPVRLGSLTPVRDMNYVADTVDGFLRCAQAPKTIGRVVNLASGTGVTVGEIAERILRLLGTNGPIVTDESRIRPEASEVKRLLGSARRAEELAGWRSQVPLEDGLKRTIDHIASAVDGYKPGTYAV